MYYKIYQKQVEEKSGTKVLKRTNKKREKFARRKQFVVACILEALKKENITKWTVQGSLSHTLSHSLSLTLTHSHSVFHYFFPSSNVNMI
jgi:hypothetical protein